MRRASGGPRSAAAEFRSCRDRCPCRAPCAPRPAGGVASHITSVTTTISTRTETRLCHRKIVWVKLMIPPGTMPPPGDDLANLRLQGAGRGHLQRRRSAQPLRPDAADAEEARGRERAVVDARDAAGDLAREHGAEHEAESPVEPRARQRKGRHHRHGALRRLGPGRGHARIEASHRRRGRQHVPGDDHERHLERERDQLPEAGAPGVDDLHQAGRRGRDAGDDHDERADQGEDERVRHVAFGPGRERERGSRDEARVGIRARVGSTGRVRVGHKAGHYSHKPRRPTDR